MAGEIPYGDKTIKLQIDLWTNDLPKGNLKTAWVKGVIHVLPNKSRGIKKGKFMFNRTSQLTSRIIDALEKSGIDARIVEY